MRPCILISDYCRWRKVCSGNFKTLWERIYGSKFLLIMSWWAFLLLKTWIFGENQAKINFFL